MEFPNLGYENEIKQLSATEEEIRFITGLLHLSSKSQVMDLYCGYGRHSIELARHGYAVTAVDSFQDLLAIARQKAQAAGVSVQFRECDMRELDYQEQFDAVINMFSAFGYYTDEENLQVLQLIAKAVKPGGMFLLDLLNRDWIVRNNLTRYWRDPEGDFVLSYKVEVQNKLVRMKRQLLNVVTNTKTQYDFILRPYSLAEVIELLTQCHFSIEAVYGGFDKCGYSNETPHMILLAKKRNESV
jgi:SAM-dependent methyltransferase